jgi:pimeloyl-ACP methyl ester carboxylesterase
LLEGEIGHRGIPIGAAIAAIVAFCCVAAKRSERGRRKARRRRPGAANGGDLSPHSFGVLDPEASRRNICAMIAPGLAPKPDRPAIRHLWTEAVSAMTPLPRHTMLAAHRAAPRGDGHAVLVMPAFLHSDRHTQPLRRFLRDRGYAVSGWQLGVNVGPTETALTGIERRLDELQARQGRKVSLIGHSLGGALARELAKKRPDAVRQLIVLASPIRLPTASPLEPVYQLFSRWHSPSTQGLYTRLNEPPTVPVTALYTRSDGIVAWQSCLEVPGEWRENIEIRGTHGTMARNPSAWRVIADRLALPDGEWHPYRA